LDVSANDSAKLLFYNIDLEQLYELISILEENLRNDVQQVKLLSNVYYFIFLRTSTIDDIQKAINRAKETVIAIYINN
jgi:hypothetical protein